jgi:hypothetical protein
LLENETERAIVESKFHNEPGTKTEAQVALYVYARFLDVSKKNNVTSVWLVTNTKLSLDAMHFAQCKRIRVIGWNFPAQGNLQDFVENPRMYPITILEELTTEEKRGLMENNVILCSDLAALTEEQLIGKYFIGKNHALEALENARMVSGANVKDQSSNA